jgi:hypothetical protein
MANDDIKYEEVSWLPRENKDSSRKCLYLPSTLCRKLNFEDTFIIEYCVN